jgi:hypothetical protein
MPQDDALISDLNSLNNLIVNCPDFQKLEMMIGGFNLFDVLKFAEGEIRHSNMLAWLMDPSESHGLDDSFLKNWLMRVIHEAPRDSTSISAVDVDTCQIERAEVRREWNKIDILLNLTLEGGKTWIICIENKINSAQHDSQLSRYHKIVDSTFPHAEAHVFVYLSRYEETPEDTAYVNASYKQVHTSLKNCLEIRKHSIGSEPAVLINNYLRLLEERFMDESDIARTAQRIYSQHKRALDLIFAHRPNSIENITIKVKEVFAHNAEKLGIIMEPSAKTYVRFCPKAWDLQGNRQGRAWVGSTRTILMEVSLGKKANLVVTAGYAPSTWLDDLWQRAAQPPFKRSREKKPYWCRIHEAGSMKVELDDEDSPDPDSIVNSIYDWASKLYLSENTQAMIEEVASRLPALEVATSKAQ